MHRSVYYSLQTKNWNKQLWEGPIHRNSVKPTITKSNIPKLVKKPVKEKENYDQFQNIKFNRHITRNHKIAVKSQYNVNFGGF